MGKQHDSKINRKLFVLPSNADWLARQMLELGSSEPWQEAMRQLTGTQTDRMEVKPMLQYFEPLRDWLKQQLKGETIGWSSHDPMLCPGH